MEYLVSLQFLVILVILSPGFFSCLSEMVTISKIAKKKKYKHADKAKGKDDGKNS